ncbi:MAG: hypothetical protein ACYTE8_10200, partial [Planctomycetota bacterium]
GFMKPAYLPHCMPEITEDIAKEVLKISKRPFVRWDTKFGEIENGQWWYVLKRGNWQVETVKDKKKRWMIRQGKKRYRILPLTKEQVLTECPKVSQMAADRYRGKICVETTEVLQKRFQAGEKIPGILNYMGCFKDDKLVSFSEDYIQQNAVWLVNMRHDPAFLKEYSSYGFIDGILDYYLNQKKMDYVLDGSRRIHHRTNFQDYLMRVFGFTKEYSRLNVKYSAKLALGSGILYPFRKCIWAVSDKLTNDFIDNVSAVLRQEEIARDYKDNIGQHSESIK